MVAWLLHFLAPYGMISPVVFRAPKIRRHKIQEPPANGGIFMSTLAEILISRQPEVYAILAVSAGRLSDRWLRGGVAILDQRQSEPVAGDLRRAL